MLSLKKIPLLLFVVVIFMARFGANATEGKTPVVKKMVKVYIDYGEGIRVDSSIVYWHDGLTAMEALQHCVSVTTRPVDEYVFVSAIDTFHNQRGGKVWYYTVNGEPAKKLAIHNRINAGDEVRWRYCDDVCSTK
ncbi:DUF4430 domain-containing protein [Alkalitalea saponilacus]|uniref:Transcobalamin-like C-terminal domain-containing protein n=1 Tax=Alkalitalea saponilacus TaxID=889453 RepID=A0A1T5BV65_9BACT|nr:DUF4430 domain-containing protein [Alkalitalea saponilacus]ASB49584.1 hypothetical protein CDL62_10745 [Alkalitalea saponilacus]SKB51031.1 protein of unknown function [Alkalitalea saponilacus]